MSEHSAKQRASKILFGDPMWLDRPDMADQMDDEFVEDNGSRTRRVTPNQLIAELNEGGARTGGGAQGTREGVAAIVLSAILSKADGETYGASHARKLNENLAEKAAERIVAFGQLGALSEGDGAWQSMETAPKDKCILVVAAHKLRPHRIAWWSERQLVQHGNGWAFDGNGFITPIAWQHLPDAAALSSTQRGQV